MARTATLKPRVEPAVKKSSNNIKKLNSFMSVVVSISLFFCIQAEVL